MNVYALKLEVKRIICLLFLIFICCFFSLSSLFSAVFASFSLSFPLMLAIAALNRLKRLLNLFDAVVLMFDRNEAHIFISSVRCCVHTNNVKNCSKVMRHFEWCERVWARLVPREIFFLLFLATIHLNLDIWSFDCVSVSVSMNARTRTQCVHSMFRAPIFSLLYLALL